MNDLEERLRATLRDRAETTPASSNPRAELARRIARKDRRKPLLAIAAAAVVVTAIAVPVVVTHRDHNPPVSTDEPYVPIPKWVELGDFVENGVAKRAWLSVDAHGKGFCIEEGPVAGQPKPYNCYGVTKWGDDYLALPEKYAAHVPVLGTPDTYGQPPVHPGPLPDLLVFMTSPKVVKLEAIGKNGLPADVREVARNAGAAYFVADFNGSSPFDMRFTAWDSKGTVLVNGTR